MRTKMSRLLGLSMLVVYGLIFAADAKEVYCPTCMHMNVSMDGVSSAVSDTVQSIVGKFSNPECLQGGKITFVRCPASTFTNTKCETTTIKARAAGYALSPSAVMHELVVSRGCAETPLSEPDKCMDIRNLDPAKKAQIEALLKGVKQEWDSVTIAGRTCYTSKRHVDKALLDIPTPTDTEVVVSRKDHTPQKTTEGPQVVYRSLPDTPTPPEIMIQPKEHSLQKTHERSRDVYCPTCMHMNVSMDGVSSAVSDAMQSILGKMSNPDCLLGGERAVVRCPASTFTNTKCETSTVKARAAGYAKNPSAIMNELVVIRGCADTPLSEPDKCVDLKDLGTAEKARFEAFLNGARREWDSVTITGRTCYTSARHVYQPLSGSNTPTGTGIVVKQKDSQQRTAGSARGLLNAAGVYLIVVGLLSSILTKP